MRPTVGSDVLPPPPPRSRKSSIADSIPSTSGSAARGPTTFFLRSEEEMEHVMVQEESNKQKDSTYGVQSLEDALESAFGDKGSSQGDSTKGSVSGSKRKPAAEAKQKAPPVTPPSAAADSSRNSSPTYGVHTRQPSLPSFSQPLTPLQLESPLPESALAGTPGSVSLRSFRLSDEESSPDEVSSQAIASSDEDEEEGSKLARGSGSFPQLVMPSIQMPSRRPFTENGKRIGRLKVLIAGEAGVGKTSLIRSIVQLCKDIVHVDPLASSPPILQTPFPEKPKLRRKKQEQPGTSSITEVYASTRAYPPWWSESEGSRVLRRRKSTSEIVLERNLCFIDTPGYGKASSFAHDTDPVIQYVESLLHQNASVSSMSDNDLVGVLSGNGGVQVDVVFYIFSHTDEITKDIEFIKRLSALTNVIPLIGKSDSLSPDRIATLKTSILSKFRSTSLKPFLFGKSPEEALWTVQKSPPIPDSGGENDMPIASSGNTLVSSSNVPLALPPFAISSAPGSDNENMDASLLMSPDYVQPLLHSDLAALVSQVFNPDSVAWLRHSAARKFLTWRAQRDISDGLRMQSPGLGPRTRSNLHDYLGLGAPSVPPQGPLTASFTSSGLLSPPSPSQVLVPRGLGSISDPASSAYLSYSYTLSRLADHQQREERLAQVRLARWASDLQRSLRNERERFDGLIKGERARWLLERVGEEVRDGTIVVRDPDQRGEWKVVKRSANTSSDLTPSHWALPRSEKERRTHWNKQSVDPRDPLGLCEWGDGVRRGGWVVVQVLGGVGVLGAVVVAVARAWDLRILGTWPEGVEGVWALLGQRE